MLNPWYFTAKLCYHNANIMVVLCIFTIEFFNVTEHGH